MTYRRNIMIILCKRTAQVKKHISQRIGILLMSLKQTNKIHYIPFTY